jgi:hypothetical protein
MVRVGYQNTHRILAMIEEREWEERKMPKVASSEAWKLV